jgi:glycosyltransferase involved in cell wall biosynthesis
MGKYGRIAVEAAFSWDRIAEQTEAIYQSIK